MMRAVHAALIAAFSLSCGSSRNACRLPPVVDSPEFDQAIVETVAARGAGPVLQRCEYSNVHGSRMWEHVNVVANDGTYYTIEYPNREREISGSRKGKMRQKRVVIARGTIGPCAENQFTPNAPIIDASRREPSPISPPNF